MSINSQKSKVTTVPVRTPGGCGDYTNTPDSVTENHVPVPSCRKFTLRLNPTSLAQSTKLQKLLTETIKIVQKQEQQGRRQSTSDAQQLRADLERATTDSPAQQALQHTPTESTRNSRKSTLRASNNLANRCRRRRSSSIDEVRMKQNRDGAKSAKPLRNHLIRTHRNGALHEGVSAIATSADSNLVAFSPTSPLGRTPVSDNYIANLATANGEIDDSTLDAMEKASRRIAFMLILNAWRHCRSHMNNSKQVTSKLESQIEQQHLQIRLLREIITTDNARVAIANEEARKSQEQVTDLEAEKIKVQQEKEEAEKKIATLESQILELNTEIKNSHNSMIMVQSQVQSLEEQLAKDREKLNRMREDKKMFVDKLKQAEEKIQQKEIDIETLQAVYAQIEERLDEQKMINISCMDEIEADNQVIKELQEQNGQLQHEKSQILEEIDSRDSQLFAMNKILQETQQFVIDLNEQNKILASRLEVTEQRLLQGPFTPY